MEKDKQIFKKKASKEGFFFFLLRPLLYSLTMLLLLTMDYNSLWYNHDIGSPAMITIIHISSTVYHFCPRSL